MIFGKILGLGESDVILIPHSYAKFADEELLNLSFSFVVIEDFDLVSRKNIYRKYRGKFKIGSTTRNFLVMTLNHRSNSFFSKTFVSEKSKPKNSVEHVKVD